MRLLITGASGFVGQHLVALTRNSEFRVRAAGRRPINLPQVEWVPLPRVQNADWSTICADMDVIVHLAAIAHVRGVTFGELQKVNRDSAIALAKALKSSQKLIFISSIRALVGPSSAFEVTEDQVSCPACAYGISKSQAEEEIKQIHENTCILRPVTVYGYNARHNMGRLASLALSGLPLPVKSFTAPRSYLSVENLCSAIAYVAYNRSLGVYHVSDPTVASVYDLVRWFRDYAAKPRRIFEAPQLAISTCEFIPVARSVLEILSKPLVAPPKRLLSEGWGPVHHTAREGVCAWVAKECSGW